MHKIQISSLIFVGIALFGCDRVEKPKVVTKEITKARAIVSPTETNRAHGMVTFTTAPGGVMIVADIDGLTPGMHGFHVHEHGDCSSHDASSAGGHFNPTNQEHGGPDSPIRHVGDLGNLVADEDGVAHYERFDKIISLNGEHSIVGKSIVVHQDHDDLRTQPTGNSGKRIGCGPIIAIE